MCIAVYKPAGVSAPTKEILRRCFDKNSDGAGYMYVKDDYVRIRKGFMTFKEFWKAYNKTSKELGNSFKDTPFVYHFRISSQAGVSKELTHPYPICSNYTSMKLQSVKCKFGLAHNGIISATSSYYVKDHNDTMEFIKEIASPLIKNENWYKKQNIMSVINYILSGNRVAVLDSTGHCELIGNWIEDKGIFYSNDGFRKSGIYGTGWKKPFERGSYYDEYYDDDEYYYNHYYYGKSSSNDKSSKDNKPNTFEEDYPATKENISTEFQKITKEQKEELKTKGTITCDKCGGYMYLDYDGYDDTYYVYCPDCGELRELTIEEGETAMEKGLMI